MKKARVSRRVDYGKVCASACAVVCQTQVACLPLRIVCYSFASCVPPRKPEPGCTLVCRRRSRRQKKLLHFSAHTVTPVATISVPKVSLPAAREGPSRPCCSPAVVCELVSELVPGPAQV